MTPATRPPEYIARRGYYGHGVTVSYLTDDELALLVRYLERMRKRCGRHTMDEPPGFIERPDNDRRNPE